MIDNLNASIHVRALLTDLFLIDEIAKPRPGAADIRDRALMCGAVAAPAYAISRAER